MKTFKDAFIPEEFKIENNKGEEFIVKTQFISSSKSKELEVLSRKLIPEFDDNGRLINKFDKDETSIDVIHNIMIARCGQDKKFWSQFSTDLLSSIAISFSEDSKKKSQIQMNSEG